MDLVLRGFPARTETFQKEPYPAEKLLSESVYILGEATMKVV